MRDVFQPVTYILASKPRGTLYTGVTSNLVQRMHQHREGLIPGFTRRYGVRCLVWYEAFDDMDAAIVRERRMKEWQRAWKIELIERDNPFWSDLAVGLGFAPLPASRTPGSRLSPG